MSTQYVKKSAVRDMNSCSFTGNIGRVDPIRSVAVRGEQTSVMSFTVACAQDTQQGTEVKENTLWLRFTVWGKRAESLASVLPNAKGVAVSGHLRQPNAYITKSNEAAASLEFDLGELRIMSWKDNAKSAPEQQAPQDNDSQLPSDDGDNGDIPF